MSIHASAAMSRGEDTAARTDSAGAGRLLRRIRAEFVEMPGLRLTAGQAARVFGVDAPEVNRLLEILADQRFLARDARGVFRRG